MTLADPGPAVWGRLDNGSFHVLIICFSPHSTFSVRSRDKPCGDIMVAKSLYQSSFFERELHEFSQMHYFMFSHIPEKTYIYNHCKFAFIFAIRVFLAFDTPSFDSFSSLICLRIAYHAFFLARAMGMDGAFASWVQSLATLRFY